MSSLSQPQQTSGRCWWRFWWSRFVSDTQRAAAELVGVLKPLTCKFSHRQVENKEVKGKPAVILELPFCVARVGAGADLSQVQ